MRILPLFSLHTNAKIIWIDRLHKPHSTLQRLEPLLPNGFTTADTVDKARTAETTLRAQREGAVATINLEELHLSYCKVFAPFSGRVINLNISAGAHVTAGVPVFCESPNVSPCASR